MKRYYLRPTLLLVVLVFSAAIATAQKTNTKEPKQFPHLVLKVAYNVQLQAKVRELQKNSRPATKLPGTKIPREVLSNANNAVDFIAKYKTRNAAVGPMFLPTPFLTYLRIGAYRVDHSHHISGIPPFQDQVLSAFFNESEHSSLIVDKDFTNRAKINSLLKKDVIAAWEIETVGTAGFKISTTGTKKYLGVLRTGGAGTEKITLTTDKNNLSTNWVIYSGEDDGIVFYNPAYNIFLGRKVLGRKIFLIPFSYKDYGNEALRKTVSISWDLYRQAIEPENSCYEAKYSHSMRYSMSYILTRPESDADGDGHDNPFCGGDDCDDTDAQRYPGAAEVCDANGHDEDCNDATFGNQDNDRDGHIAYTCFNIRSADGWITSNGDDCDDNNPAIYPGQMIFVNEKAVDVCGQGLYEVEPGFIAVRQPNGTAIVVPRN